MTSILILTVPGDIHAFAVAEALRRKGVEPVIWLTSDFPQQGTETVLFRDGRMQCIIRGPGMDLVDEPDVVWHRRPAYVVDPTRIHRADLDYVDLSCKEMRDGFLLAFAPNAFWVNARSARTRANSKILQQQIAVEAGLQIPDTIYTNDPTLIREFIATHGGKIAFKPLKAVPWRSDDNYYMPYTAELTEQQLPHDDVLRSAPAIYQAFLDKSYELRVTVIGDRIFPAKVLSQETRHGRVDWRKSYGDLRIETTELPTSTTEALRVLFDRLGIVFGCVDFVVSPNGVHWFLEVNQMGQFLFVERLTDQPMLDAFAEMLMQRTPRYQWSPDTVTVRYADLEDTLDTGLSDNSHVKQPDVTWYEGAAGSGA